MATYHPFCCFQIRERLAQIVPNVSSFQPPPCPTAHRTVTTMSATATTTDTDNNNDNNNNDNNNNNEEQQQRWHPTHGTTTKPLTWHAYGLTEHATSTATLHTMMSMTPGPHEGQGPWTTTTINNNDRPRQPPSTSTTTLNNNGQ